MHRDSLLLQYYTPLHPYTALYSDKKVLFYDESCYSCKNKQLQYTSIRVYILTRRGVYAGTRALRPHDDDVRDDNIIISKRSAADADSSGTILYLMSDIKIKFNSVCFAGYANLKNITTGYESPRGRAESRSASAFFFFLLPPPPPPLSRFFLIGTFDEIMTRVFPERRGRALLLSGTIDAYRHSQLKNTQVRVFEFHYNQIGGSSPLYIYIYCNNAFFSPFFPRPICTVGEFRTTILRRRANIHSTEFPSGRPCNSTFFFLLLFFFF